MVLIILFGVAPAAANMLGVLPVGSPVPAAVAPTVVTAKLPGGGFFTGTTTLLRETQREVTNHTGFRMDSNPTRQIHTVSTPFSPSLLLV